MNDTSRTSHSGRPPKPRLMLSGVVFAFASNLLLTTGAELLVSGLAFALDARILATMVAPLVAGLLTALYTKERGGMHAFLGAALSMPVLGFSVFGGNWQFALLSAAFCTMGGALSEIAMRRRAS